MCSESVAAQYFRFQRKPLTLFVRVRIVNQIVLRIVVFEIDDPEHTVAADDRYCDHGLALVRTGDGNRTRSLVVRGGVANYGTARPVHRLEVAARKRRSRLKAQSLAVFVAVEIVKEACLLLVPIDAKVRRR